MCRLKERDGGQGRRQTTLRKQDDTGGAGDRPPKRSRPVADPDPRSQSLATRHCGGTYKETS